MSTASLALGRLREVAASGELDDLCERHGVRLLVAFGSATRGDPGAHDLDIAVAFADGGDPVLLLDALSAAYGPVEIDLMDLSRAGPVARTNALVGCVPLYERERGVFAQAQIHAMLERMETAWLRELELELLAG